MSKQRGTRTPKKGQSPDIGERALAEHQEALRRHYHQRIRAELIQRGALRDTRSVERLLEEAAPRLRDKGWKVCEREER